MSTAHPLPFDNFSPDETGNAAERQAAMKQEIAERLAQHRQRRAGLRPGPAVAEHHEVEIDSTKRRVADAVAERFSHTKTYSEFLEEEAAAAVRRAEAAAEVARRNAEAVARAQQEMLEEIAWWEEFNRNAPKKDEAPRAELFVVEPVAATPVIESVIVEERAAGVVAAAPPVIEARPSAVEAGRAGVVAPAIEALPSPAPAEGVFRLESEGAATSKLRVSFPGLPAAGLPATALAARGQDVAVERPRESAAASSAWNAGATAWQEAFDAELHGEEAWEREVGEPVEPATPLAANLLEFPRQLVAARKARARLAEGPLREEADASPERAQLRIFEVEAEAVSTDVVAPDVAMPEWSSIRLDARDHVEVHDTAAAYGTQMQLAPAELRLMAGCVDTCCVGATFVLFAGAVAYMAHGLPTGIPAIAAGAGTLFAFYMLYYALFFTLSDATPGMRYARIGFCTFADENPTQKEMHMRMLAVLLAALPLGLGFMWAWLDEDKLGWHDRISRMYPRAY